MAVSKLSFTFVFLLLFVASASAAPKGPRDVIAAGSHFSYTISGAMGGSHQGKVEFLSGLVGRNDKEGLCSVHLSLTAPPGTDPGLNFVAILRKGFKQTSYPAGQYPDGPGRSGGKEQLENIDRIYAQLGTKKIDLDGYEDHFLSKTGSFVVDHVDENKIEAHFDFSLKEKSGEIIDGGRTAPRHVAVKGKFTHSLSKGSSVYRYSCAAPTAPLYLHYWRQRTGDIPTIKENPSCVRARDRLWSDRLLRKAYADQKWIEYARQERIYDSDIYSSLVYREACSLANEDNAQHGIKGNEDCGTIKEAIMRVGTENSLDSLMTTDSETGEIDMRDDLPENKKYKYDIAWQSALEHEKRHQKQIIEHNGCMKNPACLEKMEKKYPQAAKIEKNSEMYGKHAWFTSLKEIEAYDVSINMLEEWIRKRCKSN
ncbi:MAG TPA: hypothetical protein ENI80_00430 [Acidiferrobacteraceae bacterium]|nr:hypothetical protein [Acidiferrobacteraceae bacterium]